MTRLDVASGRRVYVNSDSIWESCRIIAYWRMLLLLTIHARYGVALMEEGQETTVLM